MYLVPYVALIVSVSIFYEQHLFDEKETSFYQLYGSVGSVIILSGEDPSGFSSG